MVGEKWQNSVVEELYFVWKSRKEVGAATKGTAKLAFGPTMLALRGIIQNYVICKGLCYSSPRWVATV